MDFSTLLQLCEWDLAERSIFEPQVDVQWVANWEVRPNLLHCKCRLGAPDYIDLTWHLILTDVFCAKDPKWAHPNLLDNNLWNMAPISDHVHVATLQVAPILSAERPYHTTTLAGWIIIGWWYICYIWIIYVRRRVVLVKKWPARTLLVAQVVLTVAYVYLIVLENKRQNVKIWILTC